MKLTLFFLQTNIIVQGFLAPQLSTTKTSNTKLLSIKSEKPTRIDIEQAAGQTSVCSDQPEKGFIQGLASPKKCCSYADCIENNAPLRQSLEKLVAPRPYTLFLLEKAAKYIVDDMMPRQESSSLKGSKEKVVLLGAGWGAATFLQNIDNNRYDVTIVSPRNYFLFTPMLAGASVGTVECRSITQPIREFNRKANYLEAAASYVDTKNRTVYCHGITCDGPCDLEGFNIPYDRLIVAVGAQINTFGIPGVEEYCSFLKQAEDAVQIRRKIVNLLERANVPNTPEEKIRELLTFAIIGAGPSGVEFAGELRDFIEEDGPKYYPHLLKYVQINVIEASPVVLRPFDETLRQAAVEALTEKSKKQEFFSENMLKLVVNTTVQEVTENKIKLQDAEDIGYGLAVWAGGIGPLPITQEIINDIGGRQIQAQKMSRGKIAVDPWLRAIDGDGRIFALGDCSCTQSACLPATAQVAAQEGEYLAHLMSVGNLEAEYEEGILMPPRRLAGKTKLMDSVTALSTGDNVHVAPFQFLDMGILAYTGRFKALAQLQVTPNNEATRIKAGGSVGFGVWRSVYLLKQSSMRNRALVFLDWTKSRIFGRDITSFGS